MIARALVVAGMIGLLIAAARTPIAVRASNVKAYRAQSAAEPFRTPDNSAAAPFKLFVERAP